MKKDPIVYIQDMLDAMNRIHQYTHNISFEQYESDLQLQDAIIHRLQIIGEAASRIPEETRNNYPNIPWRKIIGLRNVIVHDYMMVNTKEIWTIATVDLSQTKKEFETLLK